MFQIAFCYGGLAIQLARFEIGSVYPMKGNTRREIAMKSSS